MKETEISFIGGEPAKRDFCEVPKDHEVAEKMNMIVAFDKQLPFIPVNDPILNLIYLYYQQAWQSLPDEYKLELADLTAIAA